MIIQEWIYGNNGLEPNTDLLYWDDDNGAFDYELFLEENGYNPKPLMSFGKYAEAPTDVTVYGALNTYTGKYPYFVDVNIGEGSWERVLADFSGLLKLLNELKPIIDHSKTLVDPFPDVRRKG